MRKVRDLDFQILLANEGGFFSVDIQGHTTCSIDIARIHIVSAT
ncbi:hypothetical protein LCGC14_2622020 [marine sediment metagenome]|uniref:Uncharacterized protein n=1 Tax=marine sediment metagenome TaxID=412755 RepID=A0A0F9CVE4_9ZZZZ